MPYPVPPPPQVPAIVEPHLTSVNPMIGGEQMSSPTVTPKLELSSTPVIDLGQPPSSVKPNQSFAHPEINAQETVSSPSLPQPGFSSTQARDLGQVVDVSTLSDQGSVEFYHPSLLKDDTEEPSAPTPGRSLIQSPPPEPVSDPVTSPTPPPGRSRIESPPPEPVLEPVTPPPTPSPAPAATPTPNPPQAAPPRLEGVIELTADRQEYDEQRQVFTAEGNVVMRFRQAVLRSNRLQVNLVNRLAVAEGNVSLTRGEQVLLGDRFLYNFVQGTGSVQQARGQVFIPNLGNDTALLAEERAIGPTRRTPRERIFDNQPPSNVTPGAGVIIEGGTQTFPRQQGELRRIRYEAESLTFTPEGWDATNIRLTNDPFSPPELEVRADSATFRRLSPLQEELRATRPRLVFDQSTVIPILRDRVVFDREERDPALVSFGYDQRDRGGLYAERTLNLINSPQMRLQITPQITLQRALVEGSVPQAFGFLGRFDYIFTPTTRLRASVNIADFTDLENRARSSVRLTQLLGRHTLTGEYSYRDRLFNGSLGFQTVQRSIGLVLTSPTFNLGKTGIFFNYQLGYQYINATTDRANLLPPGFLTGRVDLSRYQMSATAGRNFVLWRGTPLPATPTEGLRYTPRPLVPYVQLVTSITGTNSFYSNGDHQSSLNGTAGIRGQFGHLSRPWLDYTGFGLVYSQFILSGESPFRFDRIADVRVLVAEFTQQVYGPFIFGVRSAFNLDTGKNISTEYSLEYSRRTYGISFRVNPNLGLAAFNLRISDFNWTGGPQPFSGSGVRSVEGGVIQSDEGD